MKVRLVQNLFPFYALCCLLLTLLTAPGKKVSIYSFSVLYKSCNLVLRENNESKMHQLQKTNMKQIASTKHLNLSAGEGYKCTLSSIVSYRNTVFSNSNLETKKWSLIFLLWKIFSFYICTFATGSVCPLTLPLGICEVWVFYGITFKIAMHACLYPEGCHRVASLLGIFFFRWLS